MNHLMSQDPDEPEERDKPEAKTAPTHDDSSAEEDVRLRQRIF